MKNERIPGVVLAAGDSTRFESGNKLLMPLGNHAVIFHTVRELLESQLSQVLLITGFESSEILNALKDSIKNARLKIAHNFDWPTGKASSVRVAIENLPNDAPGALFLPGDMPLMTSSLINRVLDQFHKAGRLAFPVLKGEKGHPVIFPRHLWAELSRLEGEMSAMGIVRAHWNEAEKIVLSAEEEPTQQDIDRLEDYNFLRNYFESRGSS